MRATPVRVLLIDEDDSFRVRLASVLAAQEDLEVVAHVFGKVAIPVGGPLRLDVILMGLGPPIYIGRWRSGRSRHAADRCRSSCSR
jgi:DNA-binding NarL/FixJ family response regulator